MLTLLRRVPLEKCTIFNFTYYVKRALTFRRGGATASTTEPYPTRSVVRNGVNPVTYTLGPSHFGRAPRSWV